MSRPAASVTYNRLIDAISKYATVLLTLDGSETGAVDTVDLGLPYIIPRRLELQGVSLSFAGSSSSGDWALEFYHQPAAGGGYSLVATIPVNTP